MELWVGLGSTVVSLVIGWWLGQRSAEALRNQIAALSQRNEALGREIVGLHESLPQRVVEALRTGEVRVRPTENEGELEIITAKGSVTIRPPLLEMRGEVLPPTINPPRDE